MYFLYFLSKYTVAFLYKVSNTNSLLFPQLIILLVLSVHLLSISSSLNLLGKTCLIPNKNSGVPIISKVSLPLGVK